MTYKELKDRFIKGELIERTFGRNKITQNIGKDTVTEAQLHKLKQELDVETQIDSRGFTKHLLTYKPKQNESI